MLRVKTLRQREWIHAPVLRVPRTHFLFHPVRSRPKFHMQTHLISQPTKYASHLAAAYIGIQ